MTVGPGTIVDYQFRDVTLDSPTTNVGHATEVRVRPDLKLG